MLTVGLATVALVAGLTGTWSPCGFSMIETIGGPRRSVLRSCAIFALGAGVGGLITFGTVAAAGSAVHGRGVTVAAVIAAFARDPLVAVEIFDEVQDADVWRALNIPGSPFAVVLDGDGAVRAKGTFNTYGQLESIVATAERQLADVHA